MGILLFVLFAIPIIFYFIVFILSGPTNGIHLSYLQALMVAYFLIPYFIVVEVLDYFFNIPLIWFALFWFLLFYGPLLYWLGSLGIKKYKEHKRFKAWKRSIQERAALYNKKPGR